MEEISKTAKAYYANLPEKQKRLATKFFKSMDTNGDGKISFKEFKEHLTKKGYASLCSSRLFEALDQDGSGSLDFNEFITIHYICSRGGLYWCDVCGVFLGKVYFTCVQCYNSSGDTYDLCCDCYRDKEINHHKDALFLDIITLLHLKRAQQQGGSSRNRSASQGKLGKLADIISLGNFVTDNNLQNWWDSACDNCSQM